jgi:hypothetical protein
MGGLCIFSAPFFHLQLLVTRQGDVGRTGVVDVHFLLLAGVTGVTLILAQERLTTATHQAQQSLKRPPPKRSLALHPVLRRGQR